jgi:hypothetical protein
LVKPRPELAKVKPLRVQIPIPTTGDLSLQLAIPRGKNLFKFAD